MKILPCFSLAFLVLLTNAAPGQTPEAPSSPPAENKPLDAASIAEKWKAKPAPAADAPKPSAASGTRTRSIRPAASSAPAVRTRSIRLSAEGVKANDAALRNLRPRGIKPLYGEEAAAAEHAADTSAAAAPAAPDKPARAEGIPAVSTTPALVQVPVTAEKQIAFRLHFKLNSTEFDDVTQNARQVADIATAMKSLPETTCFLLEGHTCDLGETGHNQKLSEARAIAVRTLITGYGVNPSRLLAAGFGESQPEAANTNEAARALNRRVVIGPIELPAQP